MGNRLGSPRKRKRASTAIDTASSPANASSAPALHQNDVRRPTSPSLRKEVEVTESLPAEPGDTPQTPRSQHPWQLVSSALQAVDAFAEPVKEEQERMQQRCERLALVNADPELFFAVHSMQDQPELTLEAAGLWYSNALLLKARGDLVAATQQLRGLVTADTSLTADAKIHLAQCLLLQDPTLETHDGEILSLLVECTSVSHAKTLDPELHSAATELLAHVLMARGSFHEAYELLSRCVASSASPPVDSLFALASCDQQLTKPEDPPSQRYHELLELLASSRNDLQQAPAVALMQAEAGSILAGVYK